MPSSDAGQVAALVGEKITINSRQVAVTKLLGEGELWCWRYGYNQKEKESQYSICNSTCLFISPRSSECSLGGFSYVYLVKEISDANNTAGSLSTTGHGGDAKDNGKSKGAPLPKSSDSSASDKNSMVLKVTSIVSRQQRDIAEKEAKLLSRLSHPSIIKMYDTCYRTVPAKSSGRKNDEAAGKKDRPQHLILMEFCEGGHALDVCTNLLSAGKRFDLSTLIIAFGQICNAVSYLHAQRPPIVHRDLKPANFLIKGGAYKLCDFGSAIFGHVDLKTPQDRSEAEEVIQKTTTQMFRAPEMVDLFSAKKLTQATDVWALGCCLYSMAFLQNCFEEGSNLAILSRKYKIPDDNTYGEGLVELIDRMLTIDVKARADMTEVILCLSAVYSGRTLPPRKEPKKKEKKEAAEEEAALPTKSPRRKKSGLIKPDSQSTTEPVGPVKDLDAKEGKKLDPNSVAARRKKSAVNQVSDFAGVEGSVDDAFSPFGDSAFDDAGGTEDLAAAFDATANWQGANEFTAFAPGSDETKARRATPSRNRGSAGGRRGRRKERDGDAKDDEEDGEEAETIETTAPDDGVVSKSIRKIPSRGVRRQNSSGDGLRIRNRSKGPSARRKFEKAGAESDGDDSDDDEDE